MNLAGPWLKRRQLLAGLAASAGLPVAAATGALPRNQVATWDYTTEVLITGSGAAGICAGLAAREQGARVLIVEALPQFGGVSASSAGIVYAGGGTALQEALGVTDTVAAMYDFLSGDSEVAGELEKIQLYCEQSAAHFDWLVSQGIDYSGALPAAGGSGQGNASLFISGNEQAWPASETAKPAPRGHAPEKAGMNGGRVVMRALRARAVAAGAASLANVAAQQLIVGRDGRVVGAVLNVNGERKTIRVLRGTVLTCGGFIHNRDMLQRYAADLARCSAPWGNAGDLGSGINMGIGAGAAALRMNEGCASLPQSFTERTAAGVLVNAAAQRFVAEDSYRGVLGDTIVYHQQGRAWLITDADSSFTAPQDDFPLVAKASTLGDLAVGVGFPQGALQHTLSYYNRFAGVGRDPLFNKSPAVLRPLQGPPYRAWNVSAAQALLPVYTLGGLQTDLNGRVLAGNGEPIEGLYAAGRNAAGLPAAPYLAEGLSLGDATFFGRRAGLAAAGTS